MGKGKMDKLVGGNRLEDKFKWSVQIDLDEIRPDAQRRDNFITISGTASDAKEAALAAQKARQAFFDAENAAKQVESGRRASDPADTGVVVEDVPAPEGVVKGTKTFR